MPHKHLSKPVWDYENPPAPYYVRLPIELSNPGPSTLQRVGCITNPPLGPRRKSPVHTGSKASPEDQES